MQACHFECFSFIKGGMVGGRVGVNLLTRGYFDYSCLQHVNISYKSLNLVTCIGMTFYLMLTLGIDLSVCIKYTNMTMLT